jgi:hypothetical protein
MLNAVAGRPLYEGLNAACSSYSTHQSLLVLEREVLSADPDMVVVYHAWNDFSVAPDGFSDREKERAIRWRKGLVRLAGADVRFFRVYRLAGWVRDHLDVTWPRPRVRPGRYRENLQAMAALCAERDIPMFLVIKPACRGEKHLEMGAPQLAYYKRVHGLAGKSAVYDHIHRTSTLLQKEVVSANDNVHAIDFERCVDALQEEVARSDAAVPLRVFHADGCHLAEFGEQAVAEEVAFALAPGRRHAIERYTLSADYYAGLAAEFLQDLQPDEAILYARRAMKQDPAMANGMNTLIRQAREQADFARLFHMGRWGGYDPHLSSKLCKLMKCLAYRPYDKGVRQQLYRVCAYRGLPRDEALYFSTFLPPTNALPSNLSDADIDTVSAADAAAGDVCLMLHYPEPVRLARLAMVVYHPPEGQCVKDVMVAATNDDPTPDAEWHIFRARVGQSGPFRKRLTIPEVKDGDMLCIELDPTDRDLHREYRTWGLLSLVQSAGFECSYSPNRKVMALREMIGSVY